MLEYDLGLIGLGVMGRNLALNFSDKGHSLVVFDQSVDVLNTALSERFSERDIVGASSLNELVQKLKSPRKIMLMVPAGEPVDLVIEQILPLLDNGDILIDGGNSHYQDTARRVALTQKQGVLFIGTGVSGGEEGARHGPSMMPGGNRAAWDGVKPLLQSISASVEGQACCQWVGAGGAGHYVKMVHNGIEYGDMQLIAEAYQLMHKGLGLSHQEMQTVFSQWNKGALSSYLIEITANIMATLDDDGEPLLEKILDCAGQKGTGKWTAISALEQGVPLSLISESVFARYLSSLKASRIECEKHYPNECEPMKGDVGVALAHLHDALYASKIISYAQGFMLMQQASEANQWALDFGNIALTWRGGCIIRSAFLDEIKTAYSREPSLSNLLLDEFFIKALSSLQTGWRQSVQSSVSLGIPVPAMSSALAFFDYFRSGISSANLIQAQRDYFGAHGYERVDEPRGQWFHTEW